MGQGAYLAHQRAADHHCIGHLGDARRGDAVAYAEADAYRQVGARAYFFQFTRLRVGVERRGPRDAFERDVVDETARRVADLLHALFRRIGREQENRVEPLRARNAYEVVTFFGRQVHREHAVDPGRRGGAGEFGVPHHLDRVEIAHEHHRRVAVVGAEGAHHLEHAAQAHVVRERAFAGLLDHGAIGHRVGERYAELED